MNANLQKYRVDIHLVALMVITFYPIMEPPVTRYPCLLVLYVFVLLQAFAIKRGWVYFLANTILFLFYCLVVLMVYGAR